MQDDKPIATPWLKTTQERKENASDSQPEAFKHTRAAVMAITDADLEASSPPSVIESQPAVPASLTSFPASGHPLSGHGGLSVVSEDKEEDEEANQQPASGGAYKQYTPALEPCYGQGSMPKRLISWQPNPSLPHPTLPTLYRSMSLQPQRGTVFGHSIKRVEHVLQRMADAIKMDLQLEV